MFKIIKSRNKTKKLCVITPNKKIINFGAKGYSDYTKHKNPKRMRLYIGRHGGKISQNIKNETNMTNIHIKMQKVSISTKENWTKSGLITAGFWSRWLLWSEPNMSKAINLIENKFNIKIHYHK